MCTLLSLSTPTPLSGTLGRLHESLDLGLFIVTFTTLISFLTASIHILICYPYVCSGQSLVFLTHLLRFYFITKLVHIWGSITHAKNISINSPVLSSNKVTSNFLQMHLLLVTSLNVLPFNHPIILNTPFL